MNNVARSKLFDKKLLKYSKSLQLILQTPLPRIVNKDIETLNI